MNPTREGQAELAVATVPWGGGLPVALNDICMISLPPPNNEKVPQVTLGNYQSKALTSNQPAGFSLSHAADHSWHGALHPPPSKIVFPSTF